MNKKPNDAAIKKLKDIYKEVNGMEFKYGQGFTSNQSFIEGMRLNLLDAIASVIGGLSGVKED